MSPVMDTQLIEQFSEIVGKAHALSPVFNNVDDMAPFVSDARGRYKGHAALVLKPANTKEIAQIVILANKTQTPLIPQGGNTGLVGGGLPLANNKAGYEGREVIICLSRLNQIIEVDPATNTMTVEAGALLEDLQNAADQHERLFPLSLGSQGSCQIGGNISTNAGGTGVLAYGNTRDLIMGLEVVLPTGEILNTLSKLRKDNTGYDLKNMFIGAEGTLGIVTRAVVKLFPKPQGKEVAYAALQSPNDALKLLTRAQGAAGKGLTAFELMAGLAMDFTLKHAGQARAPFQETAPWYVLLEVTSHHNAQEARDRLESILNNALQAEEITDAVVAHSIQQQNDFWAWRENMSHAQKPEGASIKHDISVPVGLIPSFIEKADNLVLDIIPNARIVNFGHMGDGNLHYNISQPLGWQGEDFYAKEPMVNEVVYTLVTQLGGSISAEHGIGQKKKELLPQVKDPTALLLMKKMKETLDPSNIMNPGKVI